MFSTDTYSANIRIEQYRKTASELNAQNEKRKKQVKSNMFKKMFGQKTA